MTLEATTECQTAGGDHPADRLPWHSDRRGDDKTRLFRYVCSRPAGVPLQIAVRDVFGQSAAEKAGPDYQLSRRFVKSQSTVKTTRRDGLLWVEPTVGAFSLEYPQYANDKTSRRRRGGLSNEKTGDKTGGESASPTVGHQRDRSSGSDTTGPTVQYPKDRAKSVISDRLVLDGSRGGHDYRAEILRELGTERIVQSDKVKILRRIRGEGPDHILIPYTTRFNSEQRATANRQGFHTVLETAAGRYSDSVIMTLTSDPSKFESLSAAMDGLTEAKQRLLSWLATDYQIGHRPENLSVLEFTDAGMPHLHVVLFGVGWAVHQRALSDKWDDLGQGRVVDIRQSVSRDNRWIWHSDDSGTVTMRQYLGKAIRGLTELAGLDDTEVRDRAERGDIGLWKQAMYWTTGKQYYSSSPGLKPTDDSGDSLPFIRQYEFVGVAQYHKIPATVRQSAVFVDRGSPP